MQKNNWKKCKLGDVCELIGGFAFKSKSFGAFANKVIKIANIQPPYVDDKLEGVDLSNYNVEKLKKYLINYNDFCLAMTGATIGKLGRYKSKLSAYLNQRVLTFRPSTDVDKDFLYHYLSLDFFQRFINNHIDSETAQPNISATSIGQFELLLPPLDEQKRIAEILGSLDDKIELLQKQNKTLEDMAKALFKSWFVDFDVVRAKQKGLPKADIMREYHLTEELYDLFPSSFADSPLGPIPSGWEVKPLSKIAILIMGQSPAGTTYNETGEGIPFYQGRTDFGFRFPKKRIYCSAPTRIAEKGDILISVRAPVGDLNMANETCCIGRGVASIRSNISKDSFLYYAMLSAQIQFDVFNTEGTVFGSINRKDLSSFSILTPIEQLVKEFNNIIGNFDLKIEENLKQIQTLTELRDTLLPALISGKIRV